MAMSLGMAAGVKSKEGGLPPVSPLMGSRSGGPPGASSSTSSYVVPAMTAVVTDRSQPTWYNESHIPKIVDMQHRIDSFQYQPTEQDETDTNKLLADPCSGYHSNMKKIQAVLNDPNIRGEDDDNDESRLRALSDELPSGDVMSPVVSMGNKLNSELSGTSRLGGRVFPKDRVGNWDKIIAMKKMSAAEYLSAAHLVGELKGDTDSLMNLFKESDSVRMLLLPSALNAPPPPTVDGMPASTVASAAGLMTSDDLSNNSFGGGANDVAQSLLQALPMDDPILRLSKAYQNIISSILEVLFITQSALSKLSNQDDTIQKLTSQNQRLLLEQRYLYYVLLSQKQQVAAAQREVSAIRQQMVSTVAAAQMMRVGEGEEHGGQLTSLGSNHVKDGSVSPSAAASGATKPGKGSTKQGAMTRLFPQHQYIKDGPSLGEVIDSEIRRQMVGFLSTTSQAQTQQQQYFQGLLQRHLAAEARVVNPLPDATTDAPAVLPPKPSSASGQKPQPAAGPAPSKFKGTVSKDPKLAAATAAAQAALVDSTQQLQQLAANGPPLVPIQWWHVALATALNGGRQEPEDGLGGVPPPALAVVPPMTSAVTPAIGTSKPPLGNQPSGQRPTSPLIWPGSRPPAALARQNSMEPPAGNNLYDSIEFGNSSRTTAVAAPAPPPESLQTQISTIIGHVSTVVGLYEKDTRKFREAALQNNLKAASYMSAMTRMRKVNASYEKDLMARHDPLEWSDRYGKAARVFVEPVAMESAKEIAKVLRQEELVAAAATAAAKREAAALANGGSVSTKAPVSPTSKPAGGSAGTPTQLSLEGGTPLAVFTAGLPTTAMALLPLSLADVQISNAPFIILKNTLDATLNFLPYKKFSQTSTLQTGSHASRVPTPPPAPQPSVPPLMVRLLNNDLTLSLTVVAKEVQALYDGGQISFQTRCAFRSLIGDLGESLAKMVAVTAQQIVLVALATGMTSAVCEKMMPDLMMSVMKQLRGAFGDLTRLIKHAAVVPEKSGFASPASPAISGGMMLSSPNATMLDGSKAASMVSSSEAIGNDVLGTSGQSFSMSPQGTALPPNGGDLSGGAGASSTVGRIQRKGPTSQDPELFQFLKKNSVAASPAAAAMSESKLGKSGGKAGTATTTSKAGAGTKKAAGNALDASKPTVESHMSFFSMGLDGDREDVEAESILASSTKVSSKRKNTVAGTGSGKVNGNLSTSQGRAGNNNNNGSGMLPMSIRSDMGLWNESTASLPSRPPQVVPTESVGVQVDIDDLDEIMGVPTFDDMPGDVGGGGDFGDRPQSSGSCTSIKSPLGGRTRQMTPTSGRGGVQRVPSLSLNGRPPSAPSAATPGVRGTPAGEPDTGGVPGATSPKPGQVLVGTGAGGADASISGNDVTAGAATGSALALFEQMNAVKKDLLRVVYRPHRCYVGILLRSHKVQGGNEEATNAFLAKANALLLGMVRRVLLAVEYNRKGGLQDAVTVSVDGPWKIIAEGEATLVSFDDSVDAVRFSWLSRQLMDVWVSAFHRSHPAAHLDYRIAVSGVSCRDIVEVKLALVRLRQSSGRYFDTTESVAAASHHDGKTQTTSGAGGEDDVYVSLSAYEYQSEVQLFVALVKRRLVTAWCDQQGSSGIWLDEHVPEVVVPSEVITVSRGTTDQGHRYRIVEANPGGPKGVALSDDGVGDVIATLACQRWLLESRSVLRSMVAVTVVIAATSTVAADDCQEAIMMIRNDVDNLAVRYGGIKCPAVPGLLKLNTSFTAASGGAAPDTVITFLFDDATPSVSDNVDATARALSFAAMLHMKALALPYNPAALVTPTVTPMTSNFTSSWSPWYAPVTLDANRGLLRRGPLLQVAVRSLLMVPTAASRDDRQVIEFSAEMERMARCAQRGTAVVDRWTASVGLQQYQRRVSDPTTSTKKPEEDMVNDVLIFGGWALPAARGVDKKVSNVNVDHHRSFKDTYDGLVAIAATVTVNNASVVASATYQWYDAFSTVLMLPNALGKRFDVLALPAANALAVEASALLPYPIAGWDTFVAKSKVDVPPAARAKLRFDHVFRSADFDMLHQTEIFLTATVNRVAGKTASWDEWTASIATEVDAGNRWFEDVSHDPKTVETASYAPPSVLAWNILQAVTGSASTAIECDFRPITLKAVEVVCREGDEKSQKGQSQVTIQVVVDEILVNCHGAGSSAASEVWTRRVINAVTGWLNGLWYQQALDSPLASMLSIGVSQRRVYLASPLEQLLGVKPPRGQPAAWVESREDPSASLVLQEAVSLSRLGLVQGSANRETPMNAPTVHVTTSVPADQTSDWDQRPCLFEPNGRTAGRFLRLADFDADTEDTAVAASSALGALIHSACCVDDTELLRHHLQDWGAVENAADSGGVFGVGSPPAGGILDADRCAITEEPKVEHTAGFVVLSSAASTAATAKSKDLVKCLRHFAASNATFLPVSVKPLRDSSVVDPMLFCSIRSNGRSTNHVVSSATENDRASIIRALSHSLFTGGQVTTTPEGPKIISTVLEKVKELLGPAAGGGPNDIPASQEDESAASLVLPLLVLLQQVYRGVQKTAGKIQKITRFPIEAHPSDVAGSDAQLRDLISEAAVEMCSDEDKQLGAVQGKRPTSTGALKTAQRAAMDLVRRTLTALSQMMLALQCKMEHTKPVMYHRSQQTAICISPDENSDVAEQLVYKGTSDIGPGKVVTVGSHRKIASAGASAGSKGTMVLPPSAAKMWQQNASPSLRPGWGVATGGAVNDPALLKRITQLEEELQSYRAVEGQLLIPGGVDGYEAIDFSAHVPGDVMTSDMQMSNPDGVGLLMSRPGSQQLSGFSLMNSHASVGTSDPQRTRTPSAVGVGSAKVNRSVGRFGSAPPGFPSPSADPQLSSEGADEVEAHRVRNSRLHRMLQQAPNPRSDGADVRNETMPPLGGNVSRPQSRQVIATMATKGVTSSRPGSRQNRPASTNASGAGMLMPLQTPFIPNIASTPVGICGVSVITSHTTAGPSHQWKQE